MNKCSICDVDRLMGLARPSRLVLYIVVIGAALFLLYACAQQARPTAAPAGVPPSASPTIPVDIPTGAPLPGPVPVPERTTEPLTPTTSATGHGPSDARVSSAADLVLQVPELVRVAPGETTSYTLTVRNLGPDPASGIVLSGVLPAGVIPLWTQPAQPSCGRQGHGVGCDLGQMQGGGAVTVTLDLSVGGSETLITGTHLAGVTVALSAPACAIDRGAVPAQVTCRLANLQPGAEAHVRLGVGADAQLAGALIHTATVTADEADANPSNNRATFTMTVGAAGVEGIAARPTTGTTDLVMQAAGPSEVTAGQLFTYTYTITNRGVLDATNVRFEDAVPSDLSLLAYAPGLPLCEQQDDVLTCYLHDLDSNETLTVTVVITGYDGQPMKMGLDPLLPGWPICYVVKERTWLHILHCELGDLNPGQATRVQLVLSAIGVQERVTTNAASVRAHEAEPITTTVTIQVSPGSKE